MTSDDTELIYKLNGDTVEIEERRYFGNGNILVKIKYDTRVYKSQSSKKGTLEIKGNYEFDNLTRVPNKYWELRIITYKDEN